MKSALAIALAKRWLAAVENTGGSSLVELVLVADATRARRRSSRPG
jgi:hypothetical protein